MKDKDKDKDKFRRYVMILMSEMEEGSIRESLGRKE